MKFLRTSFFVLNFALANKLQERMKAAAQHSTNKFGSAFTLHFICGAIRDATDKNTWPGFEFQIKSKKVKR